MPTVKERAVRVRPLSERVEVMAREVAALYHRLRALAEALQEAIDELPENLRTALILFAVEKLPQKEIAHIMKCSVQMVKWNVFEGRRRLRQRLQKLL